MKIGLVVIKKKVCRVHGVHQEEVDGREYEHASMEKRNIYWNL